MKKIFSLFIMSLFLTICVLQCSFMFFNKKSQTDNIKTTVNKSQSVKENLWCITLPLVWNDFMDKVNKGNPVNLKGGNPVIVDELNKRLYSKEDISEDSYYQVYGEISKKLKKEIEKNIYKKFKEKSDILSLINWDMPNSYLFYVMLKKEFTFLNEFEKLSSMPFNNSKEIVKYFGIGKSNNELLRENVKVLFYNSINDFAVKLNTKENEDVILFRTDKDSKFDELYDYVVSNIKPDSFSENDKLRIPYIDVNELISYDEICGKKIENTNYIITQVLQTIKFKMDNKGGSLKSEAAIGMMRASMPAFNKSRFFYFDKPFVLFLKEASKDKPYYAMKIKDSKYLVKE